MSGFCLQFLPLRGFSWSAPTAGFLDPPLEPRLLVQLQLGSSELHWKMSKLPIAQAKITSIDKCFGWELSLHVSVLISLLETSLSNKFVRSDRSSLCHYWPSPLLAVQATSQVMLLMVIQEWVSILEHYFVKIFVNPAAKAKVHQCIKFSIAKLLFRKSLLLSLDLRIASILILICCIRVQ